MINLTTTLTAGGAAFTASLVEAVEAFTIVLAAGTIRGWKPALAGSLAALGVLCVIALVFTPLLSLIPLHLLQAVIGTLLLLFGLGWLRKAILRSASLIPLHDEIKAFAAEEKLLQDEAARHHERMAWIAGLTAFKAVLLEGLEVIFIVIAVGSGRGLLLPAAAGAAIACLLVFAAGAVIHKPLARVPENTLKYFVGIMLSSFGLFWTGEGLGIHWAGGDLMLPGFMCLLFATSAALTAGARPRAKGAN